MQSDPLYPGPAPVRGVAPSGPPHPAVPTLAQITRWLCERADGLDDPARYVADRDLSRVDVDFRSAAHFLGWARRFGAHTTSLPADRDLGQSIMCADLRVPGWRITLRHIGATA